MALDPLAEPGLRRALAGARAREAHPGLAADALRELCDAVWADAGPDAELEPFLDALEVVVRRYRAAGGRLTVRQAAEQVIPVSALAPYRDVRER